MCLGSNTGPETSSYALSMPFCTYRLLKSFFNKYDVNGDKTIDVGELSQLLKDLHEDPEQAKDFRAIVQS